MAEWDLFKQEGEIDEFFSAVAHQLRTPLNVVMGWSDLLRRDSVHDEAFLKEGLETIHRSGLAQAEMISDLVDLSRLFSGKLSLQTTEFALEDSVKAAMESVRHAAESKHLSLELAVRAPHLKLQGDASRLRQIARILLSNAVKFSPDGAGPILAEIQADAASATLRVSDSGEGIDPALLPFLFRRFRAQEKSASPGRRGGPRIGLALASALVDLHGGTIRAESAGPKKGSVFTVSFPLKTR